MKPDIINELFKQYYNEALLYTLSICGNKETAEDIVSTAFFRALESSDDSIANFKPWLLAVCRNEYFAICRRQKRETGSEIPEDIPADEGELIDGIIEQEEYRTLYAAIKKLPETQREVITLYYFSEMPIRQIMSIIGKSEANTKVLLYRARENLKNMMRI